MTDELDRVLSSEPGIRPSPAFLTCVMAAVEREAVAPPPIPFPWLRALPLGAAALALAVFIVFQLLSLGPPAHPATRAASEELARTALWTLAGLLVAAASVTAAALRVER